MKMVRKQVYIEPEQEEKLKRLSKLLGMTEAKLIRHAIDAFNPVGASPRYFDPEAAKHLLEFMRKRAASLPEGGSTEKWNREDAYDERLPRFSR